MDIYVCRYQGIPLQFTSVTGMTNPDYYEEPGLNWLRTFFGGFYLLAGLPIVELSRKTSGKCSVFMVGLVMLC
jgi:hypothetical protein